ncbi:DUF3794 and LysM peptidoglycan-binding domain-containing protein [uncultured Flavonifractor sp.]|uniref:DUF3794 and LysM peptidoglycan-binding domain-containing protein n=1 Tax=uncultured Flavonifractor sp. TaxID=1193534 RepID=UPI0026302321|nr:SPOCS domain-containing protein [uncultured Flavonifractor sp.]
MELELERTALDGFHTVLDAAVAQEETVESIVPDACPDLLEVCDTEGVVCLHRKEAMEGRVELSGTIHALLLCQPDGEVGLRRLEVDLPFTCTADGPDITPGCRVVAQPRLRGADARLVNPRKVLVRADLAVDVQVFAPVTDWAPASVPEAAQAGVEQLSQSCNTCVTVCVQEKPFPFSDELTLPGSRPEAEALLKWRVSLDCGEAKVIGSKLIFKGSARLQVLYRCADGGLSTGEFELPISQLMEVSGAGEEAMCQVGLILTDLSCELDDGDGRTISVSMGLLAQAAIREERRFQLLTDVYSTLYQLDTETRTMDLSRVADRGEREVAVRELLETGVAPQDVLDAYVTMGDVSQSREGERVSLAVQVNVHLLCRTESGEMTAVTRTIPVSCPVELPEGARCSCRCSCTAPVYAAPASGGAEVRFPVRFAWLALTGSKAAAVSALSFDENSPIDHTGQPSIVLRMVSGGERLWDIAKAYCTTARDVMQANALEEEELPDGQLLLIPRKR